MAGQFVFNHREELVQLGRYLDGRGERDNEAAVVLAHTQMPVKQAEISSWRREARVGAGVDGGVTV
jgi:hypothetical protein